MAITNELLDELLKDYKKPEDLIGENGIMKELTKRLVEHAMSSELTNHLGYGKNGNDVKPATNRRNGNSKKTILPRDEELEIEVPRDRECTFEPQNEISRGIYRIFMELRFLQN